LLSACGAPPSPTAAPKAVDPTKPAAAATVAPAAATATTAPAATKPTEAAKPVATTAPAAAATTAPAAKPAGGAMAYTAPCTPEAATKPLPSGKNRLVIGTGGTGGVFYPYGGGLARIVTSKMPNTEATAEVTGGSVDNNKLLAKGEADIGMTTADSADDAAKGLGVYSDVGKVPLCTLATLYQSFIHVVALDGSGISRIEDMKGKTISVGSAGSSTEVAADRLLETAGLDPKKDITRQSLSVAESVNAMKDRKIEAFFWIGGLPTAAVTDLMATPNLKVKFIPTDTYISKLRDKYGALYVPFALKQSVYKGLEADVPGIGIGNLLVVNANMNQDLAYTLLKTWYDNIEEVKGIHPEARSLTVEGSATGSPVPFHPGAIRFFSEKGAWKG
jgi:TRAP transporter TAXI family solute receptor